YLRANSPGRPAAAVSFKEVALDGVSTIGLSVTISENATSALRLRCVVLVGSMPVLMNEQPVSRGDTAWNVTVLNLSGPHELRIDCELEQNGAPVDVALDYPLLITDS